MAKLSTRDIYQAAFHVLNGAECSLVWLEPHACTFTLIGNKIDEMEKLYFSNAHNVNARDFVEVYKDLATRLKAIKPV